MTSDDVLRLKVGGKAFNAELFGFFVEGHNRAVVVTGVRLENGKYPTLSQ